MIEIISLLALVALLLWVRHAKRVRRLRRTERARLRALHPPRYGRRAARWVLHRVLRRRFRWTAPTGRTSMNVPARVARRGLLRTIKIRVDCHLLIAGLTGSGKSSTTRTLAAHALAAGARLILIDLKPGAPEGDLYRSKARIITSLAGLVDLVRELLANPARDGSHLVIIIDETSAVVRQLTKGQFEDLCTLIDIARAFKIHCWLGIQHPSRVNLPSEIQANITATIAHRVHSRVESDVVFPGMPEWMPHKLTGPGACLIQSGTSKPHPLRALWLSEARFTDLDDQSEAVLVRAPLSEPIIEPISMIKVPPPPEPRPVRLSDQQQLVCLALEIADRPMEAKEIIAATDLPQPRVSEALKALTAKGAVSRAPDAYPHLYTLEES